nr:hypothetical protein [Nitrosomonas nitrosa]
MSHLPAILAAAATFAAACAANAETAFDRRAALALIEHDLLREDSRVFRNRERGEAIEAALELGARRYTIQLQRPQHHEFLLVIETRDGPRCPGVQTIIVGTRTGRLYHGACQAHIALDLASARAYYEAELDRLLALFRPLLAPAASARRGES